MARTMLARLALPEVRSLALPRDPRIPQIAFLGSFLFAGLTFLDFDLRPWQPPLILATACATQWAMTRLYRAPDVGYRSAIISALGLSLLLRSDVLWVPPLAAFIAIAAKFVIRVRGTPSSGSNEIPRKHWGKSPRKLACL